MEVTKKICTKCKVEKTLDDFHKSPNGKFGRVTQCKLCRSGIEKLFVAGLTDEQKQNRRNIVKNNYKENIDKFRKRQREANKMRRKTDPLFKLSGNLRNLVKNGFLNAQKKGFKSKSRKTSDILGCSFEEFKIYLEKQFDDKMNWDNQGSYWTLDHIKPVSLALTENELYSLNHFTNFRPLEKIENIRKGNKTN